MKRFVNNNSLYFFVDLIFITENEEAEKSYYELLKGRYEKREMKNHIFKYLAALHIHFKFLQICRFIILLKQVIFVHFFFIDQY